MATRRHALNHNPTSFKKFVMIAIKINQIVGYWIRSTTERLIAARVAGMVKTDRSARTRSWCPTLDVSRRRRQTRGVR
jgi:hypothetical protein